MLLEIKLWEILLIIFIWYFLKALLMIFNNKVIAKNANKLINKVNKITRKKQKEEEMTPQPNYMG